MDFSFFLKFKGLGFLSTEGESVVKYGELLNLSISNHFLQGLLQLNLCYGILPKPPMLSITSQKRFSNAQCGETERQKQVPTTKLPFQSLVGVDWQRQWQIGSFPSWMSAELDFRSSTEKTVINWPIFSQILTRTLCKTLKFVFTSDQIFGPNMHWGRCGDDLVRSWWSW